MSGAVRNFIQMTTRYRVCGDAADGVTAIRKAMASRCSLVLVGLRSPSSDKSKIGSLLRTNLPGVKIVAFGALAEDQGSLAVSDFDAVLSKEDGLAKLVETLKALIG